MCKVGREREGGGVKGPSTLFALYLFVNTALYFSSFSFLQIKTELSSVVFTPSPTSPFESFNLAQLENVDQRLSIHFENKEVYDDTMILLRFNCPDSSCDVYCPEGWAELKRHVKSVHGKVLW